MTRNEEVRVHDNAVRIGRMLALRARWQAICGLYFGGFSVESVEAFELLGTAPPLACAGAGDTGAAPRGPPEGGGAIFSSPEHPERSVKAIERARADTTERD
jgi:hypothetical protein